MTSGEALSVDRVMVATDRSETADRAVRWAANMAASCRAELILFQVLLDATADGAGVSEDALGQAGEELSLRFNCEGFCDGLYVHRKTFAFTVFEGLGGLFEGRVALGPA